MATANKFKGKLGFILVSSAAAIGLANIWRFPHLVVADGGGIFVLFYVIFAFTFGFALVATEAAIGRKTGKNPLDAFKDLTKKHTVFAKILGILPIVCCFLLVSYYPILTGWILKYAQMYLIGASEVLAADNGAFFSSYIEGFEPILFTLIVILIVAVILAFGVQKGLERISKILLPAILVCFIGMAIYAIILPGGIDGFLYCFTPNFSNFTIHTIIDAIGQAFMSIGIGLGMYITYGMYLSKKENIEKSVHAVDFFDTLVAILAMLGIIPILFVFTVGAPESLGSGTFLLFESFPQALVSLPGSGTIFGIVFYISVFIAALLSILTLIEVLVAALEARFNMKRIIAILISCSAIAVTSLLINFGYSIWKGITFMGNTILDNVDILVCNILIPISAILTCILAGWLIDTKILTDEIEAEGNKFHWKKFYVILIKFVAPIFIIIIFVTNFL